METTHSAVADDDEHSVYSMPVSSKLTLQAGQNWLRYWCGGLCKLDIEARFALVPVATALRTRVGTLGMRPEPGSVGRHGEGEYGHDG